MMAGPITPKEAQVAHTGSIPEVVFDVFNKLLSERWTAGKIVIKQDEVVAELEDALGLDRKDVFDKGWLDIETLYEKAGWEVKYDKPGYCEEYGAFWEFSKKKGT
jgi:hypothetical protein